jgi:hypothetical protein
MTDTTRVATPAVQKSVETLLKQLSNSTIKPRDLGSGVPAPTLAQPFQSTTLEKNGTYTTHEYPLLLYQLNASIPESLSIHVSTQELKEANGKTDPEEPIFAIITESHTSKKQLSQALSKALGIEISNVRIELEDANLLPFGSNALPDPHPKGTISLTRPDLPDGTQQPTLWFNLPAEQAQQLADILRREVSSLPPPPQDLSKNAHFPSAIQQNIQLLQNNHRRYVPWDAINEKPINEGQLIQTPGKPKKIYVPFNIPNNEVKPEDTGPGRTLAPALQVSCIPKNQNNPVKCDPDDPVAIVIDTPVGVDNITAVSPNWVPGSAYQGAVPGGLAKNDFAQTIHGIPSERQHVSSPLQKADVDALLDLARKLIIKMPPVR